MHIAQPATKPGLWQLFRIWGSIGLQSFGGGASTLFLIRSTFIDKHGWLTEEEMTRFWSLCLFTPGINLIALTILIGRKLGGAWGIVVSLAGLLVPSATITCLLAAGYELIRQLPATQAVIRGVIPATAGVMLLVAYGFLKPQLIRGYKESAFRLVMSIAFMLITATLLIVFKFSVVFVLLGMALLGIVFFTPKRTPIDTKSGEQA